jgi:hypothetical protein
MVRLTQIEISRLSAAILNPLSGFGIKKQRRVVAFPR